jgi:hypothetical protein
MVRGGLSQCKVPYGNGFKSWELEEAVDGRDAVRGASQPSTITAYSLKMVSKGPQSCRKGLQPQDNGGLLRNNAGLGQVEAGPDVD